jgi:hypothetical protein
MRTAKWLPVVPALVVISIGLSPILRGEAFPQWDAFSYYAPSQTLVADFAREGRFLFWDPWLSGGRPDNADPQFGNFSPINIGIGLLAGGGLLGFTLYWWIIWCLGAVGMWRLSVHFRAPTWAATAIPIAFGASGFYIGHAQHSTIIVGYSLLPWMLWRLDVALQVARVSPGEWRRVCLPAAQCGALWGLYGLNSHPAMVAANSSLIGLWTIARCATDGGLQLNRLRTTALVGLVVLGVGLPILAPPYISFLTEASQITSRHQVNRRSSVESTALVVGGLSTFASPELVALGTRHPKFWGVDNSLLTVHLCFGALALGFAAVFASPRDRWRWALLTMALLFLATALGRELPFRGWLFDYVPPFRYFRHAGVFRGNAMLLVLLLAIETARDLTGSPSRPIEELRSRRAGWIAAGIAIFLAGLAILTILRTAHHVGESGADINRAAMVAFGAGIMPAAIFIWMAVSPVAKRQALGWALVLIFTAEGIHALAISRPQMLGDGPELRAAWKRAEEGRRSSPELGEAGLDRLYQPKVANWPTNINTLTKRPTFKNYDPFHTPIYSRWVLTPALHNSILGRDRFWFSSTAVVAPADDATLSLLEAEFSRRGAPIVLLHEANAQMPNAGRLQSLPNAERIGLEDVIYEPNRLAFSIDAPTAGWLWVTDRWAPSWTATLDGDPIDIAKANLLFRAIRVPAGRHRVDFHYSPVGLTGLVFISWAVLALVALLSWRAVRRAARSDASSPKSADQAPSRTASTVTMSKRLIGMRSPAPDQRAR